MRLVLPFVLVIMGCNSWLDVPPPPPPPPSGLALDTLGTFLSPVYLTSPPVDSQRVFIVEQGGTVRILKNDAPVARPFLDLSGQISSGGERGLLSLAFHPNYKTNGRFYVYFTDPNGDIRIVRYNVSPTDPDSADEATADTVLKVAHPVNSNHNGGQLQFGPDGKLYAGLGDGGGGGDPDGNGQDKLALLGKLLRLDVDGATGYTIPADNPFATDPSGAPEVWAYGLRNPWRFSFDKQTGDLYIADVGQNTLEEVNIASTAAGRGKGLNFGWNVMEGSTCYGAASCSTTGLTLPLLEYNHANSACSITGGYVYRGPISAIVGAYFYADYCIGFVRSFRYTGSTINTQFDWSGSLSPGPGVSSFGQDAKGELYIMSLSNGGVYRIVLN